MLRAPTTPLRRPPIKGRAAILATSLVLLSILLISTAARAEIARPVHQRVLRNGLRVLVCPDPGGLDVSVRVHYDVGSRDEPGGLEGVAHLVEHLMFTGSRHVEPDGHFRLLERAGGTMINGTTSEDVTSYFETLPPERLELSLWLESDRMAYPLDRLDRATFERERAVVLHEHDDRVTDAMYGEVGPLVRSELFPSWHPYAHAPIGLRSSILRATVEDARAFVGTWYGPANAAVMIAGKVEPASAIALAERYFGSIPARVPPIRPALSPVTAASSMYLHVRAHSRRGYLVSAWVTAAGGTPGDEELDVAAAILGERLRRQLVGPGKVARGLSAHQGSRVHASVFEIFVDLESGHEPAEALAIIDQEIARLASAVEHAEIERAQRVWHGAKLFGLESSAVWAGRLAVALHLGPVPARFDGLLGIDATITPARVRDTVRRSLVRRPRVVALASPSANAWSGNFLLGREERLP